MILFTMTNQSKVATLVGSTPLIRIGEDLVTSGS